MFARYVFEQYGEHLFDAYLLDYGAEVGADDRWELLLRSLQTVDELAQTTPGLATFGLYHLNDDLFKADLARGGDAAFGGGAIRSIAAAIESPSEHHPARMDWNSPRRHVARRAELHRSPAGQPPRRRVASREPDWASQQAQDHGGRAWTRPTRWQDRVRHLYSSTLFQGPVHSPGGDKSGARRRPTPGSDYAPRTRDLSGR